jgi:hypothetical protein
MDEHYGAVFLVLADEKERMNKLLASHSSLSQRFSQWRVHIPDFTTSDCADVIQKEAEANHFQLAPGLHQRLSE